MHKRKEIPTSGAAQPLEPLLLTIPEVAVLLVCAGRKSTILFSGKAFLRFTGHSRGPQDIQDFARAMD